MIELTTLGTCAVRRLGERAAQAITLPPKRLAVFVYLVLGRPRGFQRRDILCATFWPELDQPRARNALNQALHATRKVLGDGVIVSRGREEAAVSETTVVCDTVTFEQCADAGRLEEALDLYRGDLLHGFYVPGADGFERWVDEERTRLRRRARDAASQLAELEEAASNLVAAARWLERGLAIVPADEILVRRLVDVLHRAGDRAGAIATYDRLARFLESEFETEPSAETRAMLEIALARRSPHPERRAASVAVLPFVNMSANPENEYFSEGISEELINTLSRIDGLRVPARTSSFAFKGKSEDVRSIGERLGVGWVLEGSVRRASDRVRVAAQLVSAADGYHIWSDTYDRKLEDVFAIQDEIAQSIAEALRLTLLDRARSAATRHSPDPEASQLFLKGRFFWYKENTNPTKALEYFEQAIVKDPDYALPHAGIADCFCTFGVFQLMSQEPARQKGIEAAAKAMELNETLPEVWFSSGYVRFYMQWKWSEAERLFGHALDLNPDLVQAHLFLMLLYVALRRFEEADRHAELGLALDPLSPFAHFMVGVNAYYQRQWERAIGGFREAMELDPAYPAPLWPLSVAYSLAGRHDDALETGERLAAMTGRAPPFLCSLGALYGRASREAAARRILEELRLRSSDEYVTPHGMTWLLAALGDVEEAFHCLEAAYRERNILLYNIGVHVLFDPLRDDPRFTRVLRAMNLA